MAELRCQQLAVGVIKAKEDLSETKTCCGCKKAFPIIQFPSKSKGRRKSKCKECDNQERRQVYRKRSKQAEDEKIAVRADAAQRTFSKRSKVVADLGKKAELAQSSSRSQLLLAGVLKCGVCGSNMLQVRTGYMGCYGHNLKRDSCTNNRTFKYTKVETAVVAHLQDALLNDHNINLAAKLVNKRIEERLSSVPDEVRSLIKDRAATEKVIANIMKFIKDNGEVSVAVSNELKESELRLTYIKDRMRTLERTKPEKLLVTPFAIKDKMSRLLELFNSDQVLANTILQKLLPERLSCTSLAENNGKNNNQYSSKWKIEGEIVIESMSGDVAAISDDLKAAIKLGFVI